MLGVAYSGYGATFSRLPALAAAAHVPAWALAAVAAGCLALVFASVYVTQIEKRLPLVYYKRCAQARLALDALSPNLSSA